MTLDLAFEELIIDQCGRLCVWACLGRHGEDLRIVKMAELHQASPQRHQGLRGQMHILTDHQCGGCLVGSSAWARGGQTGGYRGNGTSPRFVLTPRSYESPN